MVAKGVGADTYGDLCFVCRTLHFGVEVKHRDGNRRAHEYEHVLHVLQPGGSGAAINVEIAALARWWQEEEGCCWMLLGVRMLEWSGVRESTTLHCKKDGNAVCTAYPHAIKTAIGTSEARSSSGGAGTPSACRMRTSSAHGTPSAHHRMGETGGGLNRQAPAWGGERRGRRRKADARCAPLFIIP